MLWLTLLVAAVMLAPAFLYLVRVIKDPFHPLIFMGTMSYFLVPHRLLTERRDTLEMIDVSFVNGYLWVSLLSILGVYVGWWWGGRRAKKLIQPPSPIRFDYTKFVMFAIVFMAVALPSHFAYKDVGPNGVSGYLSDWSRLWIAASILTVQAIIVAPPGSRIPLFLLLGITVIPPVERFLNYGQRADTFRVASLVLLAYMMYGKRPSKALFLGAAVCLMIILATLQYTRNLVNNGLAPNRFVALQEVIPQFFKGNVQTVDPGDEEIFGSGIVAVSRANGLHGYGLSLTLGLVQRFLPRQFFPNKGEIFNFNGGYDTNEIQELTGLDVPYGSAPTGFANGFIEFGWLCFIPWIILMYFYRRLWDAATQFFDIRRLGMLLGYMMAMLYAVSQDLMSAEVNMVYVLLPLAIVYKLSRIPDTQETHAFPLVEA